MQKNSSSVAGQSPPSTSNILQCQASPGSPRGSSPNPLSSSSQPPSFLSSESVFIDTLDSEQLSLSQRANNLVLIQTVQNNHSDAPSAPSLSFSAASATSGVASDCGAFIAVLDSSGPPLDSGAIESSNSATSGNWAAAISSLEFAELSPAPDTPNSSKLGASLPPEPTASSAPVHTDITGIHPFTSTTASSAQTSVLSGSIAASTCSYTNLPSSSASSIAPSACSSSTTFAITSSHTTFSPTINTGISSVESFTFVTSSPTEDGSIMSAVPTYSSAASTIDSPTLAVADSASTTSGPLAASPRHCPYDASLAKSDYPRCCPEVALLDASKAGEEHKVGCAWTVRKDETDEPQLHSEVSPTCPEIESDSTSERSQGNLGLPVLSCGDNELYAAADTAFNAMSEFFGGELDGG